MAPILYNNSLYNNSLYNNSLYNNSLYNNSLYNNSQNNNGEQQLIFGVIIIFLFCSIPVFTILIIFTDCLIKTINYIKINLLGTGDTHINDDNDETGEENAENSYKNIKYFDTNQNHEELINYNDECSICLDDCKTLKKISILNCKHHYHTECIDKWININNNPQCPLCKVQINSVFKIDLSNE
jgi:hypothetical protein